jgi:hypothetical protein
LQWRTTDTVISPMALACYPTRLALLGRSAARAAETTGRDTKMITTALVAEAKLDRAAELARTSLSSRHSSEHAWQQASALALVSIARSLESIAVTLDRQQGTSASNGGASRRAQGTKALSLR